MFHVKQIRLNLDLEGFDFSTSRAFRLQGKAIHDEVCCLESAVGNSAPSSTLSRQLSGLSGGDP